MDNEEPRKKGWIAGSPNHQKVWINGKKTDFQFDGTTHNELLISVDPTLSDFGDNDGDSIEYKRGVHYRIFLWKGKFYVSLWDV